MDSLETRLLQLEIRTEAEKKEKESLLQRVCELEDSIEYMTE
jgi:hypothetical protein